MMGAVEGPADDASLLRVPAGDDLTVGAEIDDGPVAQVSSAEVLEATYRRDYGRLLGLATVLVDDPSEAAEVVHEAFARVLAGWERVRDKDDPRFYVRQAVINGARGRLRRRRVTRARAASAVESIDVLTRSDQSEELQRVDERLRVVAAIAGLPRRQRECVVLRFYDDLPGAEIARTLGISEGSVKRHLSRGLNAVRTMLEEQP